MVVPPSGVGSEARSSAPGCVVVLDPSRAARQMLSHQFRELGHTCVAAAETSVLRDPGLPRPALIVTELLLDDGDIFNGLLSGSRRATAGAPVIIHTSGGSIATAVRAMKMGALHYLVKPATASQILSALHASVDSTRPVKNRRLTLSQAKWEIIHQTVEEVGTISGAARILGLQPRSLRRMLQKTAPGRLTADEPGTSL